MYAIILDYTVPLDQIDEHLAEHVAWLDQHYAEGTFLASGRREPRTGGVILARDLPQDDLEAITATDPFAQHQLATHTLVRFHPSKLAEALATHTDLLA